MGEKTEAGRQKETSEDEISPEEEELEGEE